MRTEIICCRTLHWEMEAAVRVVGAAYPIHWLESGLHNAPKNLHAMLQTTLDSLDCDRVVMALGACGNATLGAACGRL